ncbi:ADP-ribosylglycohydrolase [Streptomyces puniciscabiei]|uniref:ADP-ribosylglycohydrolase n=1 Tax=Streptomyces puniciscabiei TaxID=164348 RepID=A0A542UL25_9ACTN|nr:ADP-ribosylglycohydrolase family protein [Streptomyces puniciscabiei]TQK99779.1 ADP-ribosylglycohydrolase [Streptomyces puniciscabiei]
MASIACTPPVPAPDDAAGLRDRARGALLGLAVGDALGAPAENLKPSEIRARWGRITGYVTERPCGTDDTEYAIFSGLLLARHGSALTPAHVEAAWHEWIADRAEGPFRGAGFSERGTLENLRRGLAAPISAQHRHAWSDGLAMRAAPFGVFAAGRPAEAARLVAIDGSVSHEGEGIYGGQAVAAGVAAAMTGAPVAVVIASALAVIPEDSWTARSLRRAVAVSHLGERAVRSAVVIGGYPWTDLAPEAVALAFGAYAAADGDFAEAVLTAVNMGRDADTTAAVAGALAGATQGSAAIPAHWSAAIGPVHGRCLPSMAGRHVLEVADLLVPGPTTIPPTPHPTEPRPPLPPTSHPTGPRPPLAPTSRPTERPAPVPPTSQTPHQATPTPFSPSSPSVEPRPPLSLTSPPPTGRPTERPAPVPPTSQAPRPATSTPISPTSPPLSPTSQPTERPASVPSTSPAHRATPTQVASASQLAESPPPLSPASRPTEKPPHLPTTPQPPERPGPVPSIRPTRPATVTQVGPAFRPPEPSPPLSSASRPTESGGRVGERGSRGRSPLVGADREGRP